MPKLTPENPLRPELSKPRSLRDQYLVEKVLGSEEAADMQELVGGQPTSPDHPLEDLGGVDLSGEEQQLGKAEEHSREKSKQEFIEWAQSIGKDREWIDERFTFNVDGTIFVDDLLVLGGCKLTEFPKQITKVRGGLVLDANNLKTLEGLPDEVEGNLTLVFNNLESVKGVPKVIHGNLVLDANMSLTNIDDLKGVTIYGSLWLMNIPCKTIPEGINLHGKVVIKKEQTELTSDVLAKGYQVELIEDEEGK